MQFKPTKLCKLCRYFNPELGHCEKGWNNCFCGGEDFKPKVPICPYCGEKMNVTYFVGDDGDIILAYTCDCSSIKAIQESRIVKKIVKKNVRT